MPQSMQRPACSVMIGSSDRPMPSGYTSFQSCTRSSTGRRAAPSPPVFKKPFGSAIECLHHPCRCLVVAEAFLLRLGLRLEHSLEVARHHLGEPAYGGAPVGQQLLGDRRTGLLAVRAQHLFQVVDLVARDRPELDQLAVDPLLV